MAYCTKENLRAIIDGYDNLLQRSESDFSAQIAMAQTWVDAYLEAAGVVVPLSSPPAFIALAAAYRTAYLITNRPDSSGAFSDYAAGFKAEAEKLLNDYLAGKADIPGTTTMQKEYGALPQAVNPGAHRT